MTELHRDAGELETLQREAEEMRRKSRKPRSASDKEPETERDQEVAEPATQISADEELTTDPDTTANNLVVEIEGVLKNMEEIASDHPAMTLLVAFTLGIFVGHIFSRK